MNKFLKTLFLGLSFLTVLIVFFKIDNKTSQPHLDLKSLEKCENIESLKIINGVKEGLSSITSLAADDIKISIGRLRVKGQLYFEGGNLRLIVNSFLGKEMDIGSNNDLFWFWSRRMRPQAVYFSNHDEVYRTSLRPIFNRDWIMDCFLFSRIQDHEGDFSFFRKDNLLYKVQLKKVSDEVFVYVITVVNVIELHVIEKYMCDLNYSILAYIKYSNFDSDHIPRSIKVNWCEEDICMDWEIFNVQKNVSISDKIWEVPKYGPMVNMTTR